MAIQHITRIDIAFINWLNKIRYSPRYINIEFIPGKNWIELGFTPGSGDFSEKSKTTEAGTTYTSELQCKIPGDRNEILNDILNLESRELIVLISYNTGERKVIGMPEFPVKMTSDLSVNKSGLYQVTFSCNSIYRARFLKD